jgi:hypothetical protein
VVFKQEVNIPMVLATGLVSVVLLGVLILGTQAWFESEEATEMSIRSVDNANPEVVALKKQQWDNIKRLEWTDKTKTTVTIPIDQAMEIMVATNGNLPSTQPSVADGTR